MALYLVKEELVKRNMFGDGVENTFNRYEFNLAFTGHGSVFYLHARFALTIPGSLNT